MLVVGLAIAALVVLGFVSVRARGRRTAMMRHRARRHGDGTAWLVADRAHGDFSCGWYVGPGGDRLAERARAGTAAEAVAWGRVPRLKCESGPATRVRIGPARRRDPTGSPRTGPSTTENSPTPDDRVGVPHRRFASVQDSDRHTRSVRLRHHAQSRRRGRMGRRRHDTVGRWARGRPDEATVRRGARFRTRLTNLQTRWMAVLRTGGGRPSADAAQRAVDDIGGDVDQAEVVVRA